MFSVTDLPAARACTGHRLHIRYYAEHCSQKAGCTPFCQGRQRTARRLPKLENTDALVMNRSKIGVNIGSRVRFGDGYFVMTHAIARVVGNPPANLRTKHNPEQYSTVYYQAILRLCTVVANTAKPTPKR